MQRSLNKYKIGLGVVGLFTLIILGIVLSQASATRQDQKTEDAANQIATKLNNYSNSNYSGYVPNSLSQAGIYDVPSTITYTKSSRYTYVFCATYKQASTSFSASTVAQNAVVGGLAGRAYGGNGGGQDLYNNMSFLYISPDHHKGLNCQTVNLYAGYTNSNSSNTYLQ